METGTTELALPGLEGTAAGAEAHPGHWIERGPWKRLMVFSGRSHPGLAQKIGEHLGVECGEVTLKTFANDETYCRYEESIRGADVFIVQTGCPPVDKNLMELLLMIQAAKLASAKRITAVVPWFPYSRQDRSRQYVRCSRRGRRRRMACTGCGHHGRCPARLACGVRAAADDEKGLGL